MFLFLFVFLIPKLIHLSMGDILKCWHIYILNNIINCGFLSFSIHKGLSWLLCGLLLTLISVSWAVFIVSLEIKYLPSGFWSSKSCNSKTVTLKKKRERERGMQWSAYISKQLSIILAPAMGQLLSKIMKDCCVICSNMTGVIKDLTMGYLKRNWVQYNIKTKNIYQI